MNIVWIAVIAIAPLLLSFLFLALRKAGKKEEAVAEPAAEEKPAEEVKEEPVEEVKEEPVQEEEKPAEEVVAAPVEEAKEEPQNEAVTPEEPDDSTITIKMSWLRNAVAVAAAVVAFFMISTPISNNNATLDVQQSTFFTLPQHNDSQDKHETITLSTEAVGSTTCQEESTEDANANTVEEETIAEPTYTIVLASQVTQRNAEIFIDQLNKADYTKARLQTSSKTNMLRVVYGTYNSQEEAIDSLRSLRKQSKQFSDAWVMEVK
jgi:hypothetical protein